MIMTMTTSVTVICQNQKPIAMMTIIMSSNKIGLFYSAPATEWCTRKYGL